MKDPSSLLCIIAGPGSGKTTVLTRRIALRALDPHINPKNTVAITFTNQAADELKIRLSALAVFDMPWVGTFHGFAFQIIRKYFNEIRKPSPTLITSKAKELHWILKNDPDIAGEIKRSAANNNAENILSTLVISEIAREIEVAKTNMIGTSAFQAWREKQYNQPRLSVSTLASIYAKYEKNKQRTNRLDFDDLVTSASEILREHPSFAQTVRWWHRHFYVDEFQDVNQPQINMIKLLVGADPDLCVVGDPKQAIYTWNGASPRLMMEFDDSFKGANFRYLTRNFRSTVEIVDMANAIASTFAQDKVTRHRTAIHAQRTQGPMPRLLGFDTSEEEAAFVAKAINDSINSGTHPGEIAILARTNSLLPKFSTELANLGIGHHIIGSTQTNQDSFTKAVLRHLIEILGPRGRLKDGLSLITEIKEEYKLDDDYRAQGTSSVDYLLHLAIEAVRNDPQIDIMSFQNYFALRVSDVTSTKKYGVTLTTLHRAKGLEWISVFFVAAEQDIVPHAKSKDNDSFEEEKRLFYVGVTRARDLLTFTYAKKRHNSNKERHPSEFFQAANTTLGLGIPQPINSKHAIRLIQSERNLLLGASKVSSTTDPVVDTLNLWSKRKRNDLGCEQTAIASNQLIDSLAKTLPTSIDQLKNCIDISEEFISSYGNEIIRLCNALKRATKSPA